MPWNWVDVVVLILILRGAFVGRRDGLSVELVKLATVFATYYCAIKYYSKCAEWIIAHSRLPLSWATVISFLGIAVLSLVTVWLFFKLLGKVVTLQFESRISTVGGLFVGTGRWLVISSLFLFALFFVPDPFVKKQVYGHSWWGRVAIDATPRLYEQLSGMIEGAQQSSKILNAHFKKEKAKLERIARETEAEGEEEAAREAKAAREAAAAPPPPVMSSDPQAQLDALVYQAKKNQAVMQGMQGDLQTSAGSEGKR